MDYDADSLHGGSNHTLHFTTLPPPPSPPPPPQKNRGFSIFFANVLRSGVIDDTDEASFSLHVQGRVALNFSIAFLGPPTRGRSQGDVTKCSEPELRELLKDFTFGEVLGEQNT